MDWRSQKIVGWVLSEGPNSRTILIAFARAMRDTSNQGGPDRVYIDNGKDYAAEAFIGKTKAHSRKARAAFPGQGHDAGDVIRGHRNVLAQRRGSRVAGCDQELFQQRAPGQGETHPVPTSTGADQQHSHPPCRPPWPAPRRLPVSPRCPFDGA